YAASDCEHAVLDEARAVGIPVRVVAPGVVERVADTVTPQRLLAVAPAIDVPIDRVRDATMLVVCAGLADPGNLGTVLRVAEAALDSVIDENGSIPRAGRTDSLNVAMAAAVIVFEAARQRRAAQVL